MFIAISGTPGTGKTAVARDLARRLHASYISITDLVKKRTIPSTCDKQRGTRIVSLAAVRSAIKKTVTHKKTVIVEGHLAHYLAADVIIILRTNPRILKQRLTKRGWSAAKITENVHAEILDSVTLETLSHRKKRVYEIDTSTKKPKETATIIFTILNNLCPKEEYSVGHISWLPAFQHELVRS